MHWWNVICMLLAIVCSVCAHPWSGCVHGEHDYVPEHDYQDGSRQVYGPYEGNGCACLLFAESILVFQTENTTRRYSCSGWGLHKCGHYCDDLLQDENVDFRSRQNACDTMGREVYTPWYRRHQVCGAYGPYEDILMPEDLCCRRGRPSDECERDWGRSTGRQERSSDM